MAITKKITSLKLNAYKPKEHLTSSSNLIGAVGSTVSMSILARAWPRVISVSPCVDTAWDIASVARRWASSKLMPFAPRLDCEMKHWYYFLSKLTSFTDWTKKCFFQLFTQKRLICYDKNCVKILEFTNFAMCKKKYCRFESLYLFKLLFLLKTLTKRKKTWLIQNNQENVFWVTQHYPPTHLIHNERGCHIFFGLLQTKGVVYM